MHMKGEYMKTINDRVRDVRTSLKLSLEKFAVPLGVKKTAIYKIETGENAVTTQMAKSICREYNVDYLWLTEGEGEMFTEFPSSLIEIIQDTYHLNDDEREIVERYFNLSPSDRKLVTDFIALLQKKSDKSL